MFRHVFAFEWHYRLRQPTLYVFSALFFFLTFMATSTDSVQIGGGIGNVARNAPFIIARTVTGMGLFGVIFLTILMATSVARDGSLGTREILYSTPLRKLPFLCGRFGASVLLSALSVAGAVLGIALASLMPYQDPEQIQAFSLVPYLYTVAFFVLPNCFLAGAIFFSVSALSGRAMATYVAMIGFFAFYGFSYAFMGDLENETLATLIDPFGLSAFDLTTRYWTIAERNTLLPPMTGALLLNRVVWMGVGAALFAFTLLRFRMDLEQGGRGKTSTPEQGTAPTAAPVVQTGPLPRIAPRFHGESPIYQWATLASFEIRAVLRSVPFIIVMLFGLLNLTGILISEMDGRDLYPVTHKMLAYIAGGFDVFLLILIVFYAAELVWRERRHKFHEIQGALPVPAGVLLAAKFSALLAVILVGLTLALGVTVGYQLFKGYTNLEPWLYFRGLYLIGFSEWILLAALAFFTQVIGRNRYLGFFLMLVYFLANTFLPEVGVEHKMFFYRLTPRFIYSDMNGYGHFASAVFWYRLAWLCLAGLLWLLSVRLWPRSTELALRTAATTLRHSWRPRQTVAVLVAVCCFATTAGWVFYNTNILNEFRSSKRDQEMQAGYEQQFRQYLELPRPRITAVQTEVDFYPAERAVRIRGTYQLVNPDSSAVEQLHLTLKPELVVHSLDVPGQTDFAGALVSNDPETGYRIHDLDQPVAPGDSLELEFELSLDLEGFVNNDANPEIVANGSFINNLDYFPRIGYLPSMELEDPVDRRKQGLEGEWHLPAPDDPRGLHTSFTDDGDWITLDAVVSTSKDQVAIASGQLVREWEQGDRLFFHYQVTEPINNFYAFLSGRYDVTVDTWNDVDIEIYHHPDHTFNVHRMIESIQETLAYGSTHFSPYPHRQMRIIEFPRYRRFAQSFPNTVPFSEAADFIVDLRDEDNIDMVYYITAHEVAHQWWGNLLSPAMVRGAQMISESLAQYTSLMVMEQDVGPERMHKFLAYELNKYLEGRGRSRVNEVPLVATEMQPWIYYNKGSLVFYALRDYLGEEAVNNALRRFLASGQQQGPPYPVAADLVTELRAETPPRYAYLIEDLFETITLYDNRAEEVAWVENPAGGYDVTVRYTSRKFRADGTGVESEIEHSDWIEIGVYGEGAGGEDRPLYLEKLQLVGGEGSVQIHVDQEPVRGGIDPRNLLIDRVADDNLKKAVRGDAQVASK